MTLRNNPMDEAHTWYKDIVDTVITDVRVKGGVQQQCDFTVLLEKVKQAPKKAQVTIQLFSSELDNDKTGNVELHGKWITMAYLVLYDDDESHKFLAKFAPTLYRLARKELESEAVTGTPGRTPSSQGRRWWQFWR